MNIKPKELKNYIGGKHVKSVSQEFFDCYNPAIGAPYTKIPDSDERDVDQAVQAAKSAFGMWSITPVAVRAKIINRLADLIEQNLEALAEAETTDNGKPLKLSTSVDIPRAAKNFRFFASAIQQFSSESHNMPGVAINYTLRKPLGVVGCISPWNLPLYLFSWKIAPALVAGNCVVAKPSEVTPLTAYLLSELCRDAGLPPGVLNIVHGTGPKVGQGIVEHPEVKAISFTGGTNTGKQIATLAAPKFKKLSLELGGKNPNIIFADCDFDRAVKTSVLSSFSNQGQICLCGSRIFVEESIYEKFKEAFVEQVKKLVPADPMGQDTKMGAVVSQSHMEKVLYYIELAKQEGGTILCGGNQVKLGGRCANGWFIEPTVIEGLSHDCRTNMEEIFGPVVTIMPFSNEDEVIKFANVTEYGLSATVWTNNLTTANKMSNQLESGIVWINCWLLRDLRTPFGGMKNSGVGREGGLEALRFFTEPKNICIKY